jgi:sporulation protein YabP
MDKVKELETNFNHGISMAERKNIVVTGVKKIETFDSEEFLMDTTLGFLHIKGKDLEIVKLDTYQGTVSIKGEIDSLSYSDTLNGKNKEESFFGKLFK